MNFKAFILFTSTILTAWVYSSNLIAQELPKLIWKVNRIQLGTILEEQGFQSATFEFVYNTDSVSWVEDVWLECGCTTAEYTQDTLLKGAEGKIQIEFDPSSAAGYFSRLIVVKGSNASFQDSLFIEGTVIPYPSNPENAYSVKLGSLGFRLRKINMGDVMDNEPKMKFVEFFNFGNQDLLKEEMKFYASDYIQIEQVQPLVRSNERGLFKITFDGQVKKELGYIEEEVQISWENQDSTAVSLGLIANLFEYYPPISKEELNQAPQLLIKNKEVNLGEISDKSVVRKTVTLSNPGRKPLEIKKIQGNCDCLLIEAPKNVLAPGESMELTLVFDPVGRKGIDQRNIYLFSNDPVNPVQLIVLKSRIE